jgi:hypothetical protein
MAMKYLWDRRQSPHAVVDRPGFTDAHSFEDLFIRRLFAGNL